MSDLRILQAKALKGDDLAADELSNKLALHFGTTIPGASVELLEASELEFPEFENIMGRGKIFIKEVLKILGPERAHGESGKLVKIRYRTRNYHHRGSIRYFLHDIERILENRLRLTHLNKEEGTETIWVFTPGFIEASLQKVFGSESVRWKYTSGEAETKGILAAYGSHERLVGLPIQGIVLGDVEVKGSKRKIHPLPFLFHDLRHGAYVAKHHELMPHVLTIRDAIWELPKPFAKEWQSVLAALADMDFDESTLENLVRDAFSFPKHFPTPCRQSVDRFLRYLSRHVTPGTVSEELFEEVYRRFSPPA